MGKKTVRLPKKITPTMKRHRTRGEIFMMLDHIQENLPNGLYTRTLAWTAGEISDNELYVSIHKHDQTYGDGDYRIPTP